MRHSQSHPLGTRWSISPKLHTLLEFQHITRELVDGRGVEVDYFAFSPWVKHQLTDGSAKTSSCSADGKRVETFRSSQCFVIEGF
jgi:hypothetical protein